MNTWCTSKRSCIRCVVTLKMNTTRGITTTGFFMCWYGNSNWFRGITVVLYILAGCCVFDSFFYKILCTPNDALHTSWINVLLCSFYSSLRSNHIAIIVVSFEIVGCCRFFLVLNPVVLNWMLPFHAHSKTYTQNSVPLTPFVNDENEPKIKC